MEDGMFRSIPPIGTIVYLEIEDADHWLDDSGKAVKDSISEVDTAAVIVRRGDEKVAIFLDCGSSETSVDFPVYNGTPLFKTQNDAIRDAIKRSRTWHQDHIAHLDQCDKVIADIERSIGTEEKRSP